MFFFLCAFDTENDAGIAEKVKKAANDERAFEELTKEFEKRNKVIASRVTGRFITESDDEWSVVLLAFFEAVKGYDPGKGSFAGFSEMVIKRRLIDHIRSAGKLSKEVLIDLSADGPGPDEEGRYDPVSLRLVEEAEAAAKREQESRDLKIEIETLSARLGAYGILFSELPDVSPVAGKTKKACAKSVMTIVLDPDLTAELKKKHRMPAKEISKRCKIPLKLLDKHRKYIIAVTEIMTGEYTALQQFTAVFRKQAESE